MKLMQSSVGVLAIVGLGYFAGVGQALLRDRPVILGSIPSKPSGGESPRDVDIPPNSPPGTGEVDPGVADESGPDSGLNSELDPLLDAPVPDGMLTLRRAHQMWIEGAYFIDSRHKHEYDLGHISGAAHLTAETFFTQAGEAEMQTIPPDAPVVIYCLGGDDCDASENTKALLQQYGYLDLSIMGVGYDEWVAAGLPTNSDNESDTQSGDTP